jgi:hypothetical protein
VSVATHNLPALLEDVDYWRGAPFDGTRGLPFKEWHHFVVFGDDWTLLLNLNLDGDGTGRSIVVLSHTSWYGHIIRCRDPRMRSGRLDATFGDSGMRWRRGRYEIWHHAKALTLEIDLEPLAVPSLSHHIRLGPGSHLSWCLVPRLRAAGWIEMDGRHLSVDRRPAYHDHNWGRFVWGGSFSWDWGCAMAEDPEDPWTVIFAQMHDRHRHRTTATSVFLLKDGRHLRYFRNNEVTFAASGVIDRRPAGRVPAAAALLAPDEDGDVPRVTRFEARRHHEHLSGEIQSRSRGQVLVPSETELGSVVRLNEVSTCARVEGRCADETIRLDGVGFLEVVRG